MPTIPALATPGEVWRFCEYYNLFSWPVWTPLLVGVVGALATTRWVPAPKVQRYLVRYLPFVMLLLAMATRWPLPRRGWLLSHYRVAIDFHLSFPWRSHAASVSQPCAHVPLPRVFSVSAILSPAPPCCFPAFPSFQTPDRDEGQQDDGPNEDFAIASSS